MKDRIHKHVHNSAYLSGRETFLLGLAFSILTLLLLPRSFFAVSTLPLLISNLFLSAPVTGNYQHRYLNVHDSTLDAQSMIPDLPMCITQLAKRTRNHESVGIDAKLEMDVE